MKKIFTLVAFGTIAGSMLAQQAPLQTAPLGKMKANPAVVTRMNEFMNKQAKQKAANKTTTVYEYLSPHDAVYNGINTGNFTTYVDPLFMDSSVVVNFGTAAPVTTMKAGGVFDGTSANYPAATPAQPSIIASQPYMIDTVWVAGEYRILGAAAGDTLQVEISWGPKASAWYAGLTIAPQKWNMPKNTPSLAAGNKCFATAPTSNSKVLRYVMTMADSATVSNPNYPYFALPANISIPAGSIVGIQYTFIPKATHTVGQTYFASPTNNSTMNSFLAILDEQTGLTATNGADYFYDASSDGTSGNLNETGRYGIYPAAQSFLNGDMLPYTNDGYLWSMSVSYIPTGIQEITNNGVSLSQNIPNPFNGVSTINYDLNTESTVVFTVMDVTGRIVAENNYGKMGSGAHQITVNSADFSKGVYFYSIKANGTSLSKKMIITE
jgi:hypothetical protein